VTNFRHFGRKKVLRKTEAVEFGKDERKDIAEHLHKRLFCPQLVGELVANRVNNKRDQMEFDTLYIHSIHLKDTIMN